MNGGVSVENFLRSKDSKLIKKGLRSSSQQYGKYYDPFTSYQQDIAQHSMDRVKMRKHRVLRPRRCEWGTCSEVALGLCHFGGGEQATTPCDLHISTILLSTEHLIDADTANIITIMFECANLPPIPLDWLANWLSTLNLQEISSVGSPGMPALLGSLHAVSATLREVPHA